MFTFGVFVCLLTSGAFASTCYSHFCHNKTTELKNSGHECVLTSIQRGKDCVNLRFENLASAPSVEKSLGTFRLSAYVKDFLDFRGRTTAFNLSISDVAFRRLITRYQDMSVSRRAACREIEIHGNNEDAPFPELFVSCPFAIETFEALPYRLEYLVIGKTFEYSRKLIFTVPRHSFIDEEIDDITMFVPFLYVDVSNVAILRLHVQPLPAKFNVTRYKIWLINNDTDSALGLELDLFDQQEIRYNFSVTEGVHYFKVAALHPTCGENGCANSTSPLINTKQPARRLLIMIISVVWIPPVILYAMYYAYKLCKDKMLAKRGCRRMNCLLVYSPTHAAHVNVMEKLAKYMRSCSIDAMIDVLDIPETVNKDPGLWCNAAFQSADVIIVATSPPPSNVVVPVIYRNMDSHALRLLKENYSRRNKRYFVVQFPYCNRDDIPEEARPFRRFDMPEDLNKLVRIIYGVDRIRFFGVSNKDFLDSIKLAMTEIPEIESSHHKVPEETRHNAEAHVSDVLIPSVIKHKTMQLEHDKSNRVDNDTARVTEVQQRSFATKIDELNLLGDIGDTEPFVSSPAPVIDGQFRIDQLNL